MRRQGLTTLQGALLAPLVPGAAILLVSIFVGDPGGGVWMFAMSALVAYPVAMLIGLPIHTALSRLGLVRIWAYLLAGLLAGCIPGWLMHPLAPYIALVSFSGGCGMATAAAFWLMVRPDRSGKCIVAAH